MMAMKLLDVILMLGKSHTSLFMKSHRMFTCDLYLSETGIGLASFTTNFDKKRSPLWHGEQLADLVTKYGREIRI